MSLRAKGSLWVAAVLVGALLLGASAGALAQHCAAPAARVVSIQGSLELRPHNTKQWQAAQTGIPICSGDGVRVGPRSRAALLLPNETTLRLDQGTTLTLSAPDQVQASLLDLILGTIHVISRTPRPFRVNTPYLNAGVEGTEFLVGSSETSARLAVFEGRVSATSAESSLMLVGGEIAYAAKGVPLRKERMLRPADAVQWALYYPTLFDHRLGEQIAGTPGEAALRESIALYRQDRLAEAIFRLDKAPEGLANPRFLTYRAGLLLLVGGADEAKAYIEGALALDAANTTAHALKSVVALTQNDKDQALKLATRAVELDQASPVARLALSYAQQAHFKIERALASVQKAVDLDPQNALAWARLAELHMSTGYLDRALEAAKRAVNLNPELAKTQSVLGFANLTRIDTQAAKQAFQKAIDLDQADPLPRLGLGLAMIREGDLSAGREQIEVAVCLDPENSLLRSYVGKAYYEEKRDKLAGIQFDLAKERDPRDPTPWFYDAIRKQTENRPVEALEDLQKSIDLNDNRAVYRSRLLLDQDRATRSASLSRSYDDLGFEQIAVVESSKSLALDPSSYSAHRFLSDAYANIPRHEIARVSELLQAQLLQPINTNPVRPRLAIKGIDVSPGGGSEHAAFNEFTPLFERDRSQAIVSGTGGSNRTLGDEAVLLGLVGRFSYSFGQYHFQTDGFRQQTEFSQRSDIAHDVYSAYGQAALSSDLNVQIEYGRRHSEQGDIRLDLDPTFVPDTRRGLQQAFKRVGLHFSPSPRSDLLVSAIHNDRIETVATTGAVTVSRFFDNRRGDEVEGQFLCRDQSFDVVLGGGKYRVRTERDTINTTKGSSKVVEIPPFPPITIELPPSESTVNSHGEFDSESLYAYMNLRFPMGFLWTIGLAYETYKQRETSIGSSEDSPSESQVNFREIDPKLGLQWDVADWLRLRAAFVRTLKRVLAVDQTIEPTQVAGFNQLFDDVNGTRADLYGFGVDAKLTRSLYVGIESKRRDLDPIDSVGEREVAHRAYLYWTPISTWSLSSEVRFRRDNKSAFLLETTEIPIEIRRSWSDGVLGRIGSTFVSQKMWRGGSRVYDSFSIVNAAIGYRFPQRRGLISVEVNNLFDQAFRFRDASFTSFDQMDYVRPYVPGRTVVAKVVLNF